jgi:hypothetical protein
VGSGIFLLDWGNKTNANIDSYSFARDRFNCFTELPKESTFDPWAGSSTGSPDDRWILFVQEDRSESDLYLVENFRRGTLDFWTPGKNDFGNLRSCRAVG